MYAISHLDDLCFICDSEECFQEMLNILHTWCECWSIVVNVKKTQIVHCSPMCIQPTAYHFKIGDQTILLKDRYKYLGRIFTEFLDYNVTAKMVGRSAGHTLGLLISKTKEYGRMPYECFTKLYDSLVQPIQNYGASIWRAKNV